MDLNSLKDNFDMSKIPEDFDQNDIIPKIKKKTPPKEKIIISKKKKIEKKKKSKKNS